MDRDIYSKKFIIIITTAVAYTFYYFLPNNDSSLNKSMFMFIEHQLLYIYILDIDGFIVFKNISQREKILHLNLDTVKVKTPIYITRSISFSINRDFTIIISSLILNIMFHKPKFIELHILSHCVILLAGVQQSTNLRVLHHFCVVCLLALIFYLISEALLFNLSRKTSCVNS